jgi:hypothetical protein
VGRDHVVLANFDRNIFTISDMATGLWVIANLCRRYLLTFYQSVILMNLVILGPKFQKSGISCPLATLLTVHWAETLLLSFVGILEVYKGVGVLENAVFN